MNPHDTAETTVNHEIPSQVPAPAPKPPVKAAVREWIRVIILALIIAAPIRYFIAEPFIVNGASMDPTFSTGQFLIVDRLSYRFEKPMRGDVIVFKYPYGPSTFLGLGDVYYIKRIVGLPGEQVRIEDGAVTIVASSTKTALMESYIAPQHASHDIGIFPAGGRKLGPTEYFVMGDNRLESSDSRVWGPLDRSFITGRPLLRVTPLSAISIYPGQSHETSAQ